jgi:tetratricopeptide (TPR) repeat protein
VANGAPINQPDRQDGYLRACEGVLRAQFGRRHFTAAARAVEQLAAEASAPERFAPEPEGSRAQRGSCWHVLSGLGWPWLRWASAVALLALVASLTYRWSTRAPQGTEIGTFTALIGECMVQRAGERTRAPAQDAGIVRLGDRIETGDADQAEIQFQDGTTLRLHFNTTIELAHNPKSKIRNPKSGSGRPEEIKLLQGQLWTKVQKSTKGLPSRYAVSTEAATAVARGTEFGVKVRRPVVAQTANGRGGSETATNLVAVLTVREGAVEFFNAFGRVEATAMTESSARSGTAPSEPKRLERLQIVRLSDGSDWTLLTSPLDGLDAAQKLAGGGGSTGLRLRNFALPSPATTSPQNAKTGEVRVVAVQPKSPAQQAGLRPGDILTAMDGQPVGPAEQVDHATLLRSGGQLTLSANRAGTNIHFALPVTNRTSAVRGPALSGSQQTRLNDLMRQWSTLGTEAAATAGTRWQASAELEAAYQNNLGVMLELKDALGPAIRAYGRAVYAQPKVPLYRYNLGSALRKIGSFERAQEEFTAAAALAPNSTPIRKLLADTHSLLGDHGEALAQAEAALQVDPNDHGLWEQKAQLLSKQQRPAEATEAAQKAVALEPDCPVALGYLASALQNAGRLAEAEVTYRRALERAPFEPALIVNFGTLQLERGDWRGAEGSIRKAISLAPGLALAHRNLGSALLEGGDAKGALGAYQKTRELDPTDASAERGIGDAQLKQRQFDPAEQAYRAALALAPDDERAHYGLGEVHRHKRRHAQAEAAYRKAIELKRDYATAYTGLAIVLQERGNPAEAEKLYRRAMDLDPSDSANYNNLGTLYREVHGNLDEAERWFRKALELAPNIGEPRSGLALIAGARGQWNEAERLLREALALSPDSSGINNNLGEILRNRGRLEEAEPYYKRALELDPDSVAAYGNLGILHSMRRQFAEAEKVFRALLDRTQGDAKLPALVNLGQVCSEQGKVEEAESFYRQALAISPNHPRVGSHFASFLADQKLKLDEALQLAQRAVAADPQNPEFVDTLGWVLAQRGELDEAERTLRKALELAGPEAAATEIREHLKTVQEKRGAE